MKIFLCIIVPTVLTLGIIRKFLEHRWGWFTCKKSLKGRVFIVTGANCGLGKETVRELVERDAKVIMACRDVRAAKKTIWEIRKCTSSGYMIPLYLDLASLDSIRTFVNVVLQDYPEIHVLINNAGIATSDRLQTKDGFELHFGVNYLGHFVLTKLLLERLKICAPSRVVIVTSSLMSHGVVDLSNLNGEKGWPKNRPLQAYYNSKLLNAYFGYELAHLSNGAGVTVYTVSPGFCATRLMRYEKLRWYQWLFLMPASLLFMRTARQGCQTILYCATSEKVARQTGLMYRNCRLWEPKINFDTSISSALWNATVKMVKDVGKLPDFNK